MKPSRIAFLTLLFALNLHPLSAEDFVEKFAALKKAKDTPGIKKLLAEAAVTEAENPDYYATVGNYWWSVSKPVTISPIKEGNYDLDPKSMTITDPKTGKKVGAIGEAKERDPGISNRALKTLSDGVEKFPQRADLVLGLVHVQKEMGKRDESIASLVALLKTAKKDPTKLEWTKGGDLPKAPEIFLPETMQTYTGALFNANTPATDKLCGTLLDAVIDTFPDHPYAYNIKAALADATGKPDEALKMLETAHQKAPSDPLILSNLAGTYVKAKKKDKATDAYQKLLKLEPDARRKQAAEQALKKLRAE